VIEMESDGRYLIDEALKLFELELPELGAMAESVRWQINPARRVTFVIDRNINYTNICTSRCRFCAFYRDVGDEDAYVLGKHEIFERIGEAIGLGATQIMLQGGLNPELGIEYFEDLLRSIKSRFDVHLHSLSPPEIVHIAQISNISIKETLSRLKFAGLDSLPGGGAEILEDRFREQISPRKITSSEWTGVMEEAHRIGMQTTATMMFGAGEEIRDRMVHLKLIRDLQDKTGGFTAFIPWTYQPMNTELGGSKVGAVEYLRMLAVSRIFLDNITNIQASWVTQGLKIAQIALFFGANDLGSTMIEENVVKAAGATFRADTVELVGLINELGLEACQRDTCYTRIIKVW
jgi:cyclic dehypoxanthinyl futalosine synthase